ncbi:MAG: ABC transporter ATP-binding protein [Gemmatales bacterium]|nr:ABC transporter ATP-binding protein [Gemmatales bacterium]MDW7993751.1 ABC transporter ATP-binding protein [Gemmatales bacterium]
MSQAGSLIIECQGLWKTFRKAWWNRAEIIALQDLNWQVYRQERWLITGPNCAGKSTLLRIVVSLLRPTRGTIYRFGKPGNIINTLAPVGYLSENVALPEFWPVQSLLQYVAHLHGVSPAQAAVRVSHLLEQFTLREYQNVRIGQLSRGLRQRVALATAFVHDPQLLVLDDPTNALDDDGLKRLQLWLRMLAPSTTVLLASHRRDLFQDWATHILALHNGRVTYSGPVSRWCISDSNLSGHSLPEELSGCRH